MGMKRLRIGGLILLLSAASALAQQPTPTPAPPRAPYWSADLPGGKFLVALDAVTSLSQSTYIVDGNARVTEVSVGTVGSVQGRFYYIEAYVPQSPLVSGQAQIDKLKDKVDEVMDRVSEDDPNTLVMKNYPTTTHAHTVEFRVNTLANLGKLYSSLESALRNRKEGKFKLP